MYSRPSAIILFAFVALWSAGAASQPAPAPDKLVVYATGDTDGKFASPRCRRKPVLDRDRLEYAHQVGYFKQLAERNKADESAFDPIALHLGDATFPGPLGRFLLRKGTSGGERVARILNQLPYETLTLGNREVGLSRPELVAFVEGALDAGLALRAANISCTSEGGAEALCDALGTTRGKKPYDVVQRGDLRILLVSALDPAIRSAVALSRLSGIDILDPELLLQRKLEEFRRQADPDLVFLQFHASVETETEDIVALTRNVPGIDVVLTNKQLGRNARPEDQDEANGFISAPKSGTYIIPAGRSPTHASVSRLYLRRDEKDQTWSIQRVDSRHVDTVNGPVAPGTAEQLWKASEQLCRRWGKPIAKNAPFDEDFNRADFTTFVLNIMRFSSNSEVALMNEGAVLNSDNFPLTGSLTYADAYTILPFDNPMFVLRVKGETLAKIAGKLDGPAVAVGLSKSGTDLRINGRAIHPDQIYTVATNQFVADGGDRIVDPDEIRTKRIHKPDWSDQTPAISDLLVHFVDSGLFAYRGPVDSRLSPRGNFPDLHRRFMWQFVGSIDASYNQVSVDNPARDGAPAYEQSQLNVQSTNQVNLEGNLQANADSLNHGWDNGLLLQYATARVNGDKSNFKETKDLIRAKSRYKYAGFYSRLDQKWWVPWPTIELQLESEFDTPDEREWHKLEMTGIVGSSFRLFSPFEFKVGVDLRRDVNDPRGETLYGLTFAYNLTRFDVADIVGSPIRFESEFEYFLNSIADENIHELRTTSRVFYSLVDHLHVTGTFSAFLFRTATVGSFGRNTEFTVGLNYLWDESFQTF